MSNIPDNYDVLEDGAVEDAIFKYDLYTAPLNNDQYYTTDQIQRPTDPAYSPQSVLVENNITEEDTTTLTLQSAVFDGSDYSSVVTAYGYTIAQQFDDLDALIKAIPFAYPVVISQNEDPYQVNAVIRIGTIPSFITMDF